MSLLPPTPLYSISGLPLQVTVGCLCASYWRGAWYIFDYTLYPHDRFKSSVSSLALGSALLAMKQYILSPSYNGTKVLVRILPAPDGSLREYVKKTNRFVSLYGIAISCVLVWRGAWLMWDVAADQFRDFIEGAKDEIEIMPTAWRECASTPTQTLTPTPPLRPLLLPSAAIAGVSEAAVGAVISATSPDRTCVQHHPCNHPYDGEDAVSHHDIDKTLFYSGIISHVSATLGLLMIGRFTTVVAPPANVSMLKDAFLHGKGREFAKAARSFVRK